MFRSVRLKKLCFTAISVICVAVLLTVSVLMLRAGAPNKINIGGEEYSLKAGDKEDIAAILAACGYDDAALCCEREVKVPVKWNKTYESYQELQKTQGLDLEPYRGKPAREAAYSVGDDEMVYILLSDGRVIAAHLCDTGGGNIRALFKE